MFGKLTEEEIKYLAGLVDADGCLSPVLNNGYFSLSFSLELAESCDRDGKLIKYLSSKVGSIYTRKREDNWSQTNTWRIVSRRDLEVLIPRLIKHMYIKAKYFSFLLTMFREFQGVKLTEEEYEELHNKCLEARLITGPIKPKNHPTWAWLTGYIEGDGWFLQRKRTHQTEQHVGLVSHSNDRCGIDFIARHFGGVVKTDNKGYIRWIKNLGPRDRTFAIHFLRKLHHHSRLKTWKIEQLLSVLLQRLNNSSSEEHAIV